MRHHFDRFLALLVGAVVVASAACGGSVDDSPTTRDDSDGDRHRGASGPTADHTAYPSVTLRTPGAVESRLGGGLATFDPPDSIRQVSLMFDGPAGLEMAIRPLRDDGDTGRWQPVEVTWREGRAHVGRVVFATPADRVELRTTAALDSLYVEFSPTVTARTTEPLTRELPRSSPDSGDGPETRSQLEAPRNLVVPREEWGARNPDKTCGFPHNPFRMTIHHTASPSDDGGDPAKRMRQMQAFHIDNRGWCDIGYHFVVSQSGKIFQGRSTEKRTGAHVGGENDGNIGISLIGNFDNQTVGSGQFQAATKIVKWVHQTYQIPLDREHVKGHTEWPGQNTSCPGANLLNRLEELLRKSGSTSLPDPKEIWDVEIRTNIVDATDRYKQGTSKSVADAFPGSTVRAEIIVTNKSERATNAIWLGYSLDTPYVQPIDYKIFDDHPEHDRESWGLNSANSATANPADLRPRGKLTLHAFSPGESKRVLIELEAARYNLGATPKPALRTWIRKIPDIYETRERWKGSASTNRVGDDLRAAVELDIPSRREWRFEETSDKKHLEGWKPCCGSHVERAVLNEEEGALAVKVGGENPRLESPDWTRIDARKWDQLVVRLRSHDGPHPAAVSWHREGGDFGGRRTFHFGAPGDGDFHTLVIPLGHDAQWSGTITGLRLEPLESGVAPDEQDSGWYDIAGLYFRNSNSGATTASFGEFPNPRTVARLRSSDDRDRGLVHGRSSQNVRVKGCSTGGRSVPAPGWWVVVGMFLACGRRNRGSRGETTAEA